MRVTPSPSSAPGPAEAADWLIATLRDEVPGLRALHGPAAAARLVFDDSASAAEFHVALRAENIDAVLDGAEVGLPIAAWYTREDVEAVALAVVKVAHYLGVRG